MTTKFSSFTSIAVGVALDTDELVGIFGADNGRIPISDLRTALNIIPNSGTIGQAAGPLMTFNDTSNYLGITGGDVGIGIVPDGGTLHVYSGSTSKPELKIQRYTTADRYCTTFNQTGSPDRMQISVAGSAVAVEVLGLLAAGGILAYNLKSGINQAGAGAAADEMWVDTADQTIKLGV